MGWQIYSLESVTRREMYTVRRQACKREKVDDVRVMACMFVKLGVESVRG